MCTEYQTLFLYLHFINNDNIEDFFYMNVWYLNSSLTFIKLAIVYDILIHCHIICNNRFTALIT